MHQGHCDNAEARSTPPCKVDKPFLVEQICSHITCLKQ